MGAFEQETRNATGDGSTVPARGTGQKAATRGLAGPRLSRRGIMIIPVGKVTPGSTESPIKFPIRCLYTIPAVCTKSFGDT